MELRLFGAALHGARRELPGGDSRLHGIEVARAYERLVSSGAIAGGFARELALLKAGIAEHSFLSIGRGQLEHRVVERMPSRERNELEAIAERRQAFAPAAHLG